MQILLGVDTLSYHCRLEEGEIELEEVVNDVAELGAAFIQINAYHVRKFDDGRLAKLCAAAEGAGLGMTLAGDIIGRDGESVDDAVERVTRWARLAEAIGSPYVRMSSGFYRNELLGNPDQIRAEQRYVIAALSAAAERVPGDVKLLLENHSDFTPEEYVEIIEGVGSSRVAVFLDIINPVSMLLQPLPVVELLAPWAIAGHAKDYRLVSHYVEDGFHRRGFDVQYCYPGEGVADIAALVRAIAGQPDGGPYRLSIEGLDNHPHVADQRERLAKSLALLQETIDASPGGAGADTEGRK